MRVTSNPNTLLYLFRNILQSMSPCVYISNCIGENKRNVTRTLLHRVMDVCCSEKEKYDAGKVLCLLNWFHPKSNHIVRYKNITFQLDAGESFRVSTNFCCVACWVGGGGTTLFKYLQSVGVTKNMLVDKYFPTLETTHNVFFFSVSGKYVYSTRYCI